MLRERTSRASEKGRNPRRLVVLSVPEAGHYTSPAALQCRSHHAFATGHLVLRVSLVMRGCFSALIVLESIAVVVEQQHTGWLGLKPLNDTPQNPLDPQPSPYARCVHFAYLAQGRGMGQPRLWSVGSGPEHPQTAPTPLCRVCQCLPALRMNSVPNSESNDALTDARAVRF
jgi:hypothetical protein